MTNETREAREHDEKENLEIAKKIISLINSAHIALITERDITDKIEKIIVAGKEHNLGSDLKKIGTAANRLIYESGYEEDADLNAKLRALSDAHETKQ